jgi:PelA/Pel-15E family pectate lyase
MSERRRAARRGGGFLIAQRTIVLVACLTTLPPAIAVATAQSPMDSIAKLPGNWAERDSASMLSGARLDSLPAASRKAWREYIDRSRSLKSRDQAFMARELAKLGRDTMSRAPYVREFGIRGDMTPEWFATDSARRVADRILTWQTPSGGWSKHVDVMLRARVPGESFFSENTNWQYIATIDNGSTTSQMEFLARTDRAASSGEPRYRDAFVRGLRYLLNAQYPNGCWPQVYPLQGGYHDAATYNDDATLHVLELLDGAASGQYPFVAKSDRDASRAATARGLECILASRVVSGGRHTVWGQQHDPLTLQPVQARSYEHASLTAQESAHVLDYLMRLPAPSDRVIAAVHDAVVWLEATPVYGLTWDFGTGLHESPGEGPLWARMYEIGTNRPIFSDRDGVIRYRWSELSDRRIGYAWYTDAPIGTLETYEIWSRRHPRPAAH